jgi:chromosome segregation ATPase
MDGRQLMPANDDTDDIMWLSYAELGKARGISTASATRLAFRRKWRRQHGNDGSARVAVPASEAQPKSEAIHEDMDDDRGDITHVVNAIETAVTALRERADAADLRAEQAEARATAAEARANQADQDRAAAQARADRADQEVASERTRADRAEQARVDERHALQADHERLIAVTTARLAEADGRADRAEQALAGERNRADMLRDRLEAAEQAHGKATQAADELRQAEAARKGRGLVARLRAAWRGE